MGMLSSKKGTVRLEAAFPLSIVGHHVHSNRALTADGCFSRLSAGDSRQSVKLHVVESRALPE